MKSYKSLVSALIKVIQMDQSDDKIRKIKNICLSIFAVVFIFIPIVVFAGVFSYFLADILQETGQTALGVHLIFCLISIFTVVFGINVVINELYFAKDLDHLLSLPLKAWEITMAKFTSVFLVDNIMQFLLVFSCVIGFGLATKMSILQWIVSLVLGFFLPLSPLLVCAIFGILLMNITHLVRSRRAVKGISILFVLVVIVVMAFSMNSMQQFDVEVFLSTPIVPLTDILFPQIGMLTGYMATGSVWEVVKFLALNIGLLIVLFVVSELFYMNSVTSISGDEYKKVKRTDIARNIKCNTVKRALFLKETHMLLRTQAFFTNCVAVTFVWPVFALLVAKIINVDMTRQHLVQIFSGSKMYMSFVFIFFVSIAIIMSSMNSLGSNAFSREGQGIFFMKYIPVNYKVQWNVKAAVGILISVLGTVPFMLVFGIYIQMNMVQILLCVMLQVAACIFVTYLGMILDAVNPKLVWDDALASLRENYNTFFCMAISMVVAIVCGFIFYFVCKGTQISVTCLAVLQLLVFVAMDVWLYRHSMKAGIENLKAVLEE